LYRKGRLREAAHRYQYALKKFPNEDQAEHNKAFKQLHINFLLNYSRCKRKLNVCASTPTPTPSNCGSFRKPKTPWIWPTTSSP
jgi:hypothetical protein